MLESSSRLAPGGSNRLSAARPIVTAARRGRHPQWESEWPRRGWSPEAHSTCRPALPPPLPLAPWPPALHSVEALYRPFWKVKGMQNRLSCSQAYYAVHERHNSAGVPTTVPNACKNRRMHVNIANGAWMIRVSNSTHPRGVSIHEYE